MTRTIARSARNLRHSEPDQKLEHDQVRGEGAERDDEEADPLIGDVAALTAKVQSRFQV